MAMQPSRFSDGNGDQQAAQAHVVQFLLQSTSYPDAVDGVERIDTHGAIVFLAGDKVYKLKRAVRLPYLDFSTVDQRHAACRNELERNAAAAPEIYIDVVPVTRDADDRLAIAGQGEPVDWLVEMNRFEQSDLLDNLAVGGNLDVALMDPLAETIADYHARARQVLDCDGEEITARVVSQVSGALTQASDHFGLPETQALSDSLADHLKQHSGLLKDRARAGFVRLCHGDLHLRNIVLSNGEPRLFDALEFDDTLATTDVLYDLAFLLMDLWHRDLKEHANRCLNTYVSRSIATNDLAGVALLPLFMSVRAAIRTMVTIDKIMVSDQAPDPAVLQEANEYFALARELITTSQPVLIAVGGCSGTGKTTLAGALAPAIGHAPGAIHLRSDVERKRMLRVPVLDKLPRHAYTSEASQNVYRRLCSRAEQALQAGHSVVVDAVFLDPLHRQWIEQTAARCGCEFLGLWLDADPDQMIDRVNKRRFDASDADGDVVRQQLKSHSRSETWSVIDARGSPETARAEASDVIADHLGPAVKSD